jgi:hypothetical protein
VKTKSKLSLEAPAGFRRECTFQRQLRDHKNSSQLLSSDPEGISNDIIDNSLSILIDTSVEEPIMSSNSLPNESFPVNVPILCCVDKPSSHLLSQITFTEDFLRSSIGFRRIGTIKTHLSDLYQDTIKLDKRPPDADLDQGEFVNLKKSNRNTTPIPRPSSFGSVIHMDIVFVPDIAVGNVHYGLLFTDRFSRMTYLYPLQNPKSDIVKQLDFFLPI